MFNLRAKKLYKFILTLGFGLSAIPNALKTRIHTSNHANSAALDKKTA